MSAIWNGLQQLLGSTISFFYDLIPNLGVAIILLTILIGLILFPLTLKQTRSMKSMQEIQPEVKRLQKDLKHDKAALQEATMALYKEKGVNPAAGCLPLILQMPIWFALFSVLRQFANVEEPTKFIPDGSSLADAIGRFNTDFLWMDLTRAPSDAFNDGFLSALPYIITILVVMATAYWQQKQTMAKSNQDPNQKQPGQAIMKIFPVFFGFISFNLPAGLVVYFAASQIFRIGQQAFILRLDASRAEAADSAPKTSPPKSTGQKPEALPPGKKTGSGSRGSTPGSTTPKPQQGSQKNRSKKRRRR